MTSLAKRERFAMAQTFRNLGPDAPTLCEGWNAFDLLLHLIIRENRPDAAAGIVIPGMKNYANKIKEGLRLKGFETLVQEFANGPRNLSIFSLPGVDDLANTIEFVIHHEDLLRAQANYSPRVFSDEDKKILWKGFTKTGKFFLFKAKVGVIAKSEQGTYTMKSGNSCVTIEGDVIDLWLYTYGRKTAANIKFDGDEKSIKILQETKLGI